MRSVLAQERLRLQALIHHSQQQLADVIRREADYAVAGDDEDAQEARERRARREKGKGRGMSRD